MYETLAMLKPGASYSLDDLERLVTEVAQSGEAAVSRSGKTVRMVDGEAYVTFTENKAPYVVVESNDIAAKFAMPCKGCPSRFEIGGDDPEMELFNDYLLVAERLQGTGLFVIFDPHQCKLMFDVEDKTGRDSN